MDFPIALSNYTFPQKGIVTTNETFLPIYFQGMGGNVLLRLHDPNALNSHICFSLFLYIFFMFSYLPILQNWSRLQNYSWEHYIDIPDYLHQRKKSFEIYLRMLSSKKNKRYCRYTSKVRMFLRVLKVRMFLLLKRLIFFDAVN